jgi:hypothetical protein
VCIERISTGMCIHKLCVCTAFCGKKMVRADSCSTHMTVPPAGQDYDSTDEYHRVSQFSRTSGKPSAVPSLADPALINKS